MKTVADALAKLRSCPHMDPIYRKIMAATLVSDATSTLVEGLSRHQIGVLVDNGFQVSAIGSQCYRVSWSSTGHHRSLPSDIPVFVSGPIDWSPPRPREGASECPRKGVGEARSARASHQLSEEFKSLMLELLKVFGVREELIRTGLKILETSGFDLSPLDRPDVITVLRMFLVPCMTQLANIGSSEAAAPAPLNPFDPQAKVDPQVDPQADPDHDLPTSRPPPSRASQLFESVLRSLPPETDQLITNMLAASLPDDIANLARHGGSSDLRKTSAPDDDAKLVSSRRLGDSSDGETDA